MNYSKYIPEVRFADIDAMGHVNNSVYLTYFEQARIHYFSQNIEGGWNWRNAGILVARNEINYVRPVLLHDKIEIAIRCSHIGSKSFTLSYELNRGDELCTSGLSVLVCYNHEKKETMQIPEEWSQMLRKTFIESPKS